MNEQRVIISLKPLLLNQLAHYSLLKKNTRNLAITTITNVCKHCYNV